MKKLLQAVLTAQKKTRKEIKSLQQTKKHQRQGAKLNLKLKKLLYVVPTTQYVIGKLPIKILNRGTNNAKDPS
ncbi:Hypothetical protein FKW44_002541 [Caligus rogercresseyi]|uniref:Uncharacterized protein n=1 Tax=Caligus rogercresseyi TaxID=217165 RepID=A0A7T8KKB5_CALRO|nr:Hypothetical protein FKW44_002541 [Caligus rogercresseyi]